MGSGFGRSAVGPEGDFQQIGHGVGVQLFHDVGAVGLDRLDADAQVLERIVAGRLNKQIADDLGISIKTVEAHRANIMEKLNANTVADLLKIALGANSAAAKA